MGVVFCRAPMNFFLARVELGSLDLGDSFWWKRRKDRGGARGGSRWMMPIFSMVYVVPGKDYSHSGS